MREPRVGCEWRGAREPCDVREQSDVRRKRDMHRKREVRAIRAISSIRMTCGTTRAPMLLTVRDVEAELQLGRTRTYELLRSGSIPVIRVGRALRVPRDALRRWVEEQTA